VLGEGPDTPTGRGTFGGRTLPSPDVYAVEILIRKMAAAMRPQSTITVATCCLLCSNLCEPNF